MPPADPPLTPANAAVLHRAWADLVALARDADRRGEVLNVRRHGRAGRVESINVFAALDVRGKRPCPRRRRPA